MADYEPLLDVSLKRESLDQISHPEMYALYETHQKSYWTPGEVSFREDVDHWNNQLTANEREFFKHILQFFAVSDFYVAQNCANNFRDEVAPLEYTFFYDFQTMMENVHNITYGNMIKALVPDQEERTRMFNSVQTHPFIKKKIDWVKTYMNRDIFFRDRVVVMACMEGIFFSASFCSIFWLKHRGLMPGVCQANEWISRDENLHTLAGCCAHRELRTKSSRILEIVQAAVELESEFVYDALSRTPVVGLSAESMIKHVKYVADLILVQLGHNKFYNIPETFEWMVLMNAHLKENFFDSASTMYHRPAFKRLKSGVLDTENFETMLNGN